MDDSSTIAITRGSSGALPEIPDVGTVREMRDALDQTSALKHMLDSLQMMDSYFVRFIDFEVGVLNQVDSFKDQYKKVDSNGNVSYRFRMDGASRKDRLRHAKLAEWWAALSDSDRARARDVALETRKTIRGVSNDWKTDDFAEQLRSQRSNAIRYFNLHSEVDIDVEFFDTREARSRRSLMIRSVKDDLRRTLRKHGAVGVGNGTYVKPGRNSDNDLNALKLRYRNLTATTVACMRLYDSARRSDRFDELTDVQQEFLSAVRGLFSDASTFADSGQYARLRSGTMIHVRDGDADV